MIKNLVYIVFLVLLYSCETKSPGQQVLTTDSVTIEKQFTFFNDKLSIESKVKPFEEDARNTVSELAFTAYTDIKKYSFLNLFQRGIMSITVADFKEADSSFDAE